MAREAMITRAIVGAKVVAMVVDIDKAETLTQTFELGHYSDDAKKVHKAVEKLIDDENIKLVKVLDVQKTEKLLGITEADFIKYAVELDPKTRKRLA